MGLCKFNQNQGPWFGVGQREGVNHWSLVRFSVGGCQQWASRKFSQNQGPWFNHWSLVRMTRFSVGGCQQWASQQIQAKSRTMVCHGSVGGCQPLVLG